MTQTNPLRSLGFLGLATLFAFGLHPNAFAEGAPAESLTVGIGKAKLNGLLQGWALHDSKNPTDKINFRLRRAEIKLSGSVIDDTRWFVMIDPAKSLKAGAVSTSNDNKILQDFGVGFTLIPDLELVVGQFKTPSTAEGLDSSSELLLPERSYVGRNFGDRREPGAQLSYKTWIFKFAAMASNGQGTNVDDVNNEKDLNVRVDATPMDSLKAGAFITAGDFHFGKKGRWGLNARYTWDALLLRAEAVQANDTGNSSTGWVGEAGYSVTDRFQPVARYEAYKTSAFMSHAATFGINYFVSKNASKIQASCAILNDMTGNNGGSYAPSRGTNGVLSILSFQAAI